MLILKFVKVIVIYCKISHNTILTLALMIPIKKENWKFNGTPNLILPFDSTSYCPDSLLPTNITHNFNLEVFTNWGCSHNATIEVNYWKNPEITYSINYPEGLCGRRIPFNFTTSYLDADSMSVTINDPLHSGAFPNSPWIEELSFTDITPHEGIFDLEIYLKNSLGNCILTIDTLEIKAYPFPRAIYDTLDLIFCYDKDTLIKFIDLSDIPTDTFFQTHDITGVITTEITQWQWSIKEGLFSNPFSGESIAEHNFVPINDSLTLYDIELVVWTNFGCSDTANSKVSVLPSPTAHFLTKPQPPPNFGTYLLDGRASTSLSPLLANPNSYNYNWIIADGPVDIVSIFNTEGDNGKNYFPSPEYLYYQFNSFEYGENDSTEICLEVISKLNISLGLTKECKDIICKNIHIQAWAELYIPNALYPESGDPGSSLFLPKGKSLIEYSLQIFDKFGNLLWETDEINENDGSPKVGWNGTSNGASLPQGTYIWKIGAKFKNGPWQGVENDNKKTGVVYLIR